MGTDSIFMLALLVLFVGGIVSVLSLISVLVVKGFLSARPGWETSKFGAEEVVASRQSRGNEAAIRVMREAS